MDFAKSFVQGLFEAIKLIFIDVINGLLNEMGKSALFTETVDILKGLAISGSAFGIIALLLYKVDKIWEIINKVKTNKRK